MVLFTTVKAADSMGSSSESIGYSPIDKRFLADSGVPLKWMISLSYKSFNKLNSSCGWVATGKTPE